MAKRSKNNRWRKEGEAMVTAWQASGLTLAAYARSSGIAVRRLRIWRKRLAAEERADSGTQFLPVTVSADASDSLRLVLPHGVSVDVGPTTDLSLLRRVVDALGC